MLTGWRFHRLLVATATVLTTAWLTPTASAQTLWDWGGDDNVVAGSGRQTVRFSPNHQPGQLIVSFSDRLLYHVTRPGEAVSYPIAIPREESRWQGVMTVTQKRINPSWTPTPEMRAENPKLPSWVPGGHPMNPLGVRGLYLGTSTYRIHGTDAPWTIGQPVSKGCIRMYNQDVIDLYDRVPVGTKVTVTWNSFRGGTVVAGAPPPAEGRRAFDQQRSTATPLARMQDDTRGRPNYSGYYFDDRAEPPRYRSEDLGRRETRGSGPDRAMQSRASVSASAATVPLAEMSRSDEKTRPSNLSRPSMDGSATYPVGDDEPYTVDRNMEAGRRAETGKARVLSKERTPIAEVLSEPIGQRKPKRDSADQLGRNPQSRTTGGASAPDDEASVTNTKQKLASRSAGRPSPATGTAGAPPSVRSAALTDGSDSPVTPAVTGGEGRKPLRRSRASAAADAASQSSVAATPTSRSPVIQAVAPAGAAAEVTPD